MNLVQVTLGYNKNHASKPSYKYTMFFTVLVEYLYLEGRVYGKRALDRLTGEANF